MSEMLDADRARRRGRGPRATRGSSTAGIRRRSSSTRDDRRGGRAGPDAELRDHIAFAQEQVRTFAAAQRATLTDLEIETRPGRRARPSPHPGRRGRLLRARRALPDARLGVHDGRRRQGRRRRAGRRRARRRAAARASHPAMLLRDGDLRAPTQILCLGGVQALAAMAFGIEGLRARRHDRRRRQRLRRRGQAPAVRPGRDRPARRADRDPRDRRRARRPRARRRRPARPGRARPELAGGPDHDLGASSARAVLDAGRRLLETWPTRGGRRRGLARPRLGRGRRRSTTRRSRSPTSRARAPRGPGRTPSKLDYYLDSGCATTARCSSASRRPSPTATRRSAPTTCCRRWRAARYTGGLWVGKFLKTCTYQRLTPEGTRAIAPAVAAICHAEHFGGHALTAEMRLERAAAER